jgi:hypothetical protein
MRKLTSPLFAARSSWCSLLILLIAGCTDTPSDDDTSSTPGASPTPTTASAPRLELTPTSLVYEDIELGTTDDQDLELRNTGSADLIVTAELYDSADDRFSLVSSTGSTTVAPAGTATITVRYAPLEPLESSGLLRLSTNDESHVVVDVPLTGNGISPVVDADEDGYSDGEDCDDQDPAVNSGATETCNGLDDNCDRQVDEGLETPTWYADADQDSFGDDGDTLERCAAPEGYIAVGGTATTRTTRSTPARRRSATRWTTTATT